MSTFKCSESSFTWHQGQHDIKIDPIYSTFEVNMLIQIIYLCILNNLFDFIIFNQKIKTL